MFQAKRQGKTKSENPSIMVLSWKECFLQGLPVIGYISLGSIVLHGHPRLRKRLGLIYLALLVYITGNGRVEEEGGCNNGCRVTLHSLPLEVPLRRCGSSTNAESFMTPLFICSISVYYHVSKLTCSWLGGFMGYII